MCKNLKISRICRKDIISIVVGTKYNEVNNVIRKRKKNLMSEWLSILTVFIERDIFLKYQHYNKSKGKKQA